MEKAVHMRIRVYVWFIHLVQFSEPQLVNEARLCLLPEALSVGSIRITNKDKTRYDKTR